MNATLLLVPLLALSIASRQDEDPAPTRAELEAHVRTLASDEMAGREPGTEGARRAARYLAEELHRAGLRPAGEGEGPEAFLQPFPGVRIVHPSAPRLLFTTKAGEIVEGVYGQDFNLIVRGTGRSTEVLPIFLIDEESDVPDQARPDQALLFRGTPADRDVWLGLRGQGKGEGWGLDLQAAPSDQPGKPRSPQPARTEFGEPEPEACEVVLVRGDMREAMLWRGYTHAQLLVDEVRTDVVESNVVALLPGTDPAAKDEVVVLQADYDFLGEASIGAREDDSDRVRNGPNEASGAAVLLEVAEALAARGGTKRTVVFLLSSAGTREKIGVDRFLASGVVAPERVVCVLGVGLVGRADPEHGAPGRLFLTGAGTSDLLEGLGEAELDVLADPFEGSLFLRGPTHPFFRQGLVAHELLSVTPDAPENVWRASADDLDHDHLAAAAATVEAIVTRLADGGLTPERVERPRGAGGRGRKR